jgi:hypothetical protein
MTQITLNDILSVSSVALLKDIEFKATIDGWFIKDDSTGVGMAIHAKHFDIPYHTLDARIEQSPALEWKLMAKLYPLLVVNTSKLVTLVVNRAAVSCIDNVWLSPTVAIRKLYQAPYDDKTIDDYHLSNVTDTIDVDCGAGVSIRTQTKYCMTVLKMLRAFTEEQEVYLAKDPLTGYTVYDHNVDVTEHTLKQVALVLSRQFTGLPVDFNEKEQYLTINGITYTYNPERYFGYDVTLVINAIDIKDTETLLKRVIATSVLFTHALILANHSE